MVIMKIYPYNPHSTSAKSLAKALNIKRIKHNGKVIFPDIVINWGASQFNRSIVTPLIVNHPYAVALAVNKLQAFNHLKGNVGIPDYTESLEEASRWLAEDVTIVERHTLTGHSGEGVRIVEPGQELQEAPMYVKYIAKKHEYRIHVFRDKVFFVQRKARQYDVPIDEVNWKVRNIKGGFIYANQNVDVADVAKEQAIITIKALGLDFGAVDMIYNERHNKFYVLEVNTAPGLTNTTLDKYVEVFKELQ